LGDVVGALETIVDEREEIVLDLRVEDLAVGEVAQNPHHRPRREILCFAWFGHGYAL